MEKTLLFYHIPKAGGYSMVEVLSEIYGPWSRQTEPYMDGVWRVGTKHNARDFPKARCVIGHLAYRQDWPGLAATMLRHPIERVASLYYYKRGLGGDGREQQWTAFGFDETTTLFEFVACQRELGAHNGMVAQLAGSIDLMWDGTPLRRVRSDDFNLACHNIKHMTVGLLEKPQQSLRLLADRAEWPVVPRMRHENRSRRPGTINDQRVIDLITECNQYDLMLYRMIEQNYA